MSLPAVISSEKAKLEVSTDGATFIEIPGIASFNLSGGDPETRTTTMWKGSRTQTGSPTAPTINCDFGTFLPHHPAFQALQDAFSGSTKVRLKLVTLEHEELDSGTTTVAIASADGACTFNPANAIDFTTDDFGAGFVFEIGANKYVIESISDAGVVKCVEPAANVAAATFKILTPSLRLGGANGLTVGVGSPGANLPSQGDLGSSVVFTPTRPLTKADWSVV